MSWGSLSEYAADLVVDDLRTHLGYVALSTGNPLAGGSIGELSGDGYARQAVTFAPASGGAAVNSSLVQFVANGGDWSNPGQGWYISVWDSSSGGNLIAVVVGSTGWPVTTMDPEVVAGGLDTIVDGATLRISPGVLRVGVVAGPRCAWPLHGDYAMWGTWDLADGDYDHLHDRGTLGLDISVYARGSGANFMDVPLAAIEVVDGWWTWNIAQQMSMTQRGVNIDVSEGYTVFWITDDDNTATNGIGPISLWNEQNVDDLASNTDRLAKICHVGSVSQRWRADVELSTANSGGSTGPGLYLTGTGNLTRTSDYHVLSVVADGTDVTGYLARNTAQNITALSITPHTWQRSTLVDQIHLCGLDGWTSYMSNNTNKFIKTAMIGFIPRALTLAEADALASWLGQMRAKMT